MDSSTSLQILTAFRNTISDEITGKQSQLDAFDVAFDLIDNGYKTDQSRIDSEIQKGKDAVANQLESLTSQVASLQGQVSTLIDENKNATIQIGDLQAQIATLQFEIDNPDKPLPEIIQP